MLSIKKHILEQVARRTISQEEGKTLLTELAEISRSREESDPAAHEPIAIVGMAGRFPRAQDAEAFWQVLRNGINCIRDFPLSRKKDFEHILRNPSYTEFLISTTIPPEDIEHAHAPAGYLDEIDKFDAAFFGIPPAEATFMDPHQRAALELTWAAMEDAGYGGQSLYGSNTGVYIGKEGTNYSLYRYCTVSHPMQLTGSWESIMASRISYLFDFRGPCMLVDTACSAGLVSIHMAAEAILSGECDQALAGGINLSVTGEFGRGYQGSMAMEAVESSDSVIRTFDARANGTVWGEGVAMVMLKRLSRAVADGDHIHAVILGSAINNDGASSGLTAPDAASQEEVIVRAWKKADIDPTTLSYVEAHGTGTVLGDPIEFKGLTAAFRRYTDKRQFCAIGSLKTNMGHLVAVSGVASLFKVVKSLQHRELAPTINFGQPNPYINFLNSPLYVSDSLRPWQVKEGPRRAALSSFGFSHTNCHMVLEEAPAKPVLAHRKAGYCLSLSAHSQAVLLDYVDRLRAGLAGTDSDFADVCFTLNVGRGHYPHRLAMVITAADDIYEKLTVARAVVAGDKRSEGSMFYASHAVVSDKKRELADGELTERSKKALSEQAAGVLSEFLAVGGSDLGKLAALAQLYATGADVDWRRFHNCDPRNRVSLPTYPFQRIRVWADPKITQIKSSARHVVELHPLVQQLASRSTEETLFESVFAPDTHWVLADHRINGSYVVPGTTYLEMARVAAEQAQGWHSIELCDVFFLMPMVVEEGESRSVRLRVLHSDANVRFEIESRTEGADDSWQRHVEGLICQCAVVDEQLALEPLKLQATESIENFVAETDTGVFQFGPHWDSIRSAWRIGEDALARLSLPPALQNEIGTYKLHPSVLDNAVNLISQSTGSTYLPFTYKSFCLHAPMTAEIYSHVVSKPRKGSNETLTYDIVLTDQNGKLLARINDYVVKKVSSFAGLGGVDHGADGEYLEARWVLQSASDAVPAACQRLLLIADGEARRHAGLIDAFSAAGIVLDVVSLVDAAQAAIGGASLRADDEEAFARFAASDALEGVEGIVLLVDGAADSTTLLGDPAEFARARQTSVDALFRLTRALLTAKASLPWGLCVLTQAAYEVDGSEAGLDPLAAATHALGSVIGMEYASLPCRLVDASVQGDNTLIVRHLLAATPGRVIALRQQGDAMQSFVRELQPLRFEAVEAPAPHDDGFCLVTGGLGGLGLAVAHYLVERASRKSARLVLTGRSQIAAREQWRELADAGDARYAALLSLAEKTAALDYIACDIADPAAVEALLASSRAAHGPLRAVFHLAGVAGEGFLLRKEFARFDAVLRPKLEGLRNLYAATANDAPDCFVLFSSIVALTGGEGQGDYAAANAFMDALAWQARRDGRALLSLNWPSWKDVGMAADFQVREDETPFLALAPADAFARLERVLAAGPVRAPVQLLPSTIHPAAIAAVQAMLPFTLAPELQRRLPRLTASSGDDGDDIEVSIRGKDAEDLSEIEVTLAKVYAAVLGLAEIDVFSNFYDMGGNSIIATHLLKLIDSRFPGVVDISDVFSYSSIDDMAAYIDEKSGRDRMSVPAAKGAANDNWEAMLDGVVDGGDIGSLLDKIK